MTEEKNYYPFTAVNDFMRDDYRLTILNEVLSRLDAVPAGQKLLITRLITKGVQIQGFRNSNLAPAAMKAKKSTTLFENLPQFAGQIMEAWSRLHATLREEMGRLLAERGWQVMEDSADLSLQPGFKPGWPKTDTFQVLIEAARVRLPDMPETDDDISLMAVWVGNCLPYELYENAE
ncbi:MAG TPA: hypothetical protein PK040_00575 [Anaerolineaceae bacterium]|nr:hypothetical protein [Anaerolineaceae bacterium]